MTLYRSRRRQLYADEDVRLLRAVAPHLNRAVSIEDRLTTVVDRRRAVGLSRSGHGLSPRERDCLP
jgi:hypothetical protein